MKTLHQLVGVAAVALLSAKLVPAGLALSVLWVAGALLSRRVRVLPFNLVSHVEGHDGFCAPVWVNRNRIDYMLTGAATGFFRRCVRIGRLPLVWLTGPEFHGYLRGDRVLSTSDGRSLYC